MELTAQHLSLYLVTDPGLCADHGLVETVRAAVLGGVTFVQLRDKNATTDERVRQARAIKDALRGSGVPFVINDDVEAALAADVDGVHIGQDDMTPEEVRARLGPDKIVGLSCETEAHVRAVDPRIVDYLGLGTVFPTATKPDHKPTIGLAGLAHLAALSPLPTVAIGGLKADHVGDVRAQGCDGLAVVSAICGTEDPLAATKALRLKIEDYA